MARTKKWTGTVCNVKGGMPHQKRGGNAGHAVDSGFGAKGNNRRSKKVYPGRD